MRLPAKSSLTTNVVPALTLAGLTLFVLLRLPYALYYGALGVAPDEVGLGYVETLGRSTVGVAALTLIPSVAVGLLAFGYRFAALGLRIMRGMRTLGFRIPSAAQLDDSEYAVFRAKRRAALLQIGPSLSAEIDDQLARSDELRALCRTEARTPAEEARMEVLTREKDAYGDALVRRSLAHGASRTARRAGWGLLGVLLIVTLVGLPVEAHRAADRVRACHQARIGPAGLFAIRGDHATLARLADDGSIHPVLTQRLIFLGRGDTDIVVFDCDSKHTVRVPADGIVVAAQG